MLGYSQSGIPVTIAVHCIEQASINDIENSSNMLSAFKSMKGTVSALRNTADSTALLVGDFSSCGIAYLGTYDNGNTVSVTAKSCALGYYSFGHELGHNFGATHDPDVRQNNFIAELSLLIF